LDEEAADEVRAFLEEVAATRDLIVLFDAKGWGVWSSVELPRGSSRTEGEGDAVLRVQLGQALREMNQMVPGREDGEAMELEWWVMIVGGAGAHVLFLFDAIHVRMMWWLYMVLLQATVARDNGYSKQD
jgi:hypothetical protein